MHRSWLLICAAALVAAASLAQASSWLVYDDGDPVYNGGVFALGSSGRPVSGSSYDGTVPLVCRGDLLRYSSSGWCRDANRLAAFITNAEPFSSASGWTLEIDAANDVVLPDVALHLFLVNTRPTAATLNTTFPTLLGQMLFWLQLGDQLPDDDAREGFRIEAIRPGTVRTVITPSPRLDPVPDATGDGHNIIRIQWKPETNSYEWTLSNSNGSRTVTWSAADLRLNPSEVYVILGTPNPALMGSGWTVHSITFSIQSWNTNFGARKQLLVDDHVVAERSGLTRELGTVTKANNGAAIFPSCSAYATAAYDQGIFKLWYRQSGIMKYAESQDGLNWTYRANVTGLDTDTLSCTIDPHETDPNHRYKGAYCPQEARAALGYSANGINWTPYNNGEPVTYRAADTFNQILWDVDANLYRLYTRTDFGTSGGAGEIRGNRCMSNPDVKANSTNWTDLGSWKFDQEGPEEYHRRQVYQLTDWIYEGVHFGIMAVYEYPGDVSEGPTDYYTRHERDIISFYIGTSRNGHTWDLSWVYANKQMVPRGPSGSFDKDMLFPTVDFFTHQGKHWIYYTGCKERHDMPRTDAHWGLGLAWLRLDGMVYLQAGGQPGTLLTKPFSFQGDELHVNSDSTGGSLKVEILGPDGQPLPGYGAADCDFIDSDSTDHLVTWRGKSRLDGVPTEGVSLRFHLINSRLYSFQFRAAPTSTPVASIAAGKDSEDGALLSLPPATVVARYDRSFYAEQADRSSGIRVVSPAPVTVGDTVRITGTLQVRDGEREIVARDVR